MSRNCEVINSRTRAQKWKFHFLTWMRMAPVSHVSKVRKGSFTGPSSRQLDMAGGSPHRNHKSMCPGFISVAVIKTLDTRQCKGRKTDFTLPFQRTAHHLRDFKVAGS